MCVAPMGDILGDAEDASAAGHPTLIDEGLECPKMPSDLHSLYAFGADEDIAVVVDHEAGKVTFSVDSVVLSSAQIPPALRWRRLRPVVYLPLAGSIATLAADPFLQRCHGTVVEVREPDLFRVALSDGGESWCSRSDVCAAADRPSATYDTHLESVFRCPCQRAVRGAIKQLCGDKVAAALSGGGEKYYRTSEWFLLDEDFEFLPKPALSMPTVKLQAFPSANRFEVAQKYPDAQVSSYCGIMFDVVAHADISITAISAVSKVDSQVTAWLYTRKQPCRGAERDATKWTQLVKTEIQIENNQPFTLSGFHFDIEAHQTCSMYINTSSTDGVSFVRPGGRLLGEPHVTVIDSDGILDVMMGVSCQEVHPFSGMELSAGRGFRGVVEYTHWGAPVDSFVPNLRGMRSCPAATPKAELTGVKSSNLVVQRNPLADGSGVKHSTHARVTVHLKQRAVLQKVTVSLTGTLPQTTLSLYHSLSLSEKVDDDDEALEWAAVQSVSTGSATLHLSILCEPGRHCFVVKACNVHENEQILVAQKPFKLMNPVPNEGTLLGGLFFAYPPEDGVPTGTLTEFAPGITYNPSSSRSYAGLMFDLESTENIILEEFFWLSGTDATVQAEIFWHEGSMERVVARRSAWTCVLQNKAVTIRKDQLYSLGQMHLTMIAGKRYSIYIHASSCSAVMFFSDADGPLGGLGQPFDNDGALTIYAGRRSASTLPFDNLPAEPVAMRGTVRYIKQREAHRTSTSVASMPVQQAYIATRIMLALRQFLEHAPAHLLVGSSRELIPTIASIAACRADICDADPHAYEVELMMAMRRLDHATIDCGRVELPVSANIVDQAPVMNVYGGDWVFDFASGTFGAVKFVDAASQTAVVALDKSGGSKSKLPFAGVLPLRLCGACRAPFFVAECPASKEAHRHPLSREQALRSQLLGLLTTHDPDNLHLLDALVRGDTQLLTGLGLDSARTGPQVQPNPDGRSCKIAFSASALKSHGVSETAWFACGKQRWMLHATLTRDEVLFRLRTDAVLRHSAKQCQHVAVTLSCPQAGSTVHEHRLVLGFHDPGELKYVGVMAAGDLLAIARRDAHSTIDLLLSVSAASPPTELPRAQPLLEQLADTTSWVVVRNGKPVTVSCSRHISTGVAPAGAACCIPLNSSHDNAVETVVLRCGYRAAQVTVALVPAAIEWLRSIAVLSRATLAQKHATLTSQVPCGGVITVTVFSSQRAVLRVGDAEKAFRFSESALPIACASEGPCWLYVTSEKQLDLELVSHTSRHLSFANGHDVDLRGRTAQNRSCHDDLIVLGNPLPTQSVVNFGYTFSRGGSSPNGEGGRLFCGMALESVSQTLLASSPSVALRNAGVYAIQNVADSHSLKAQQHLKVLQLPDVLFTIGTKIWFTFDRNNGTLSVSCDGEDLGTAFSGLPKGETFVPFVLLAPHTKVELFADEHELFGPPQHRTISSDASARDLLAVDMESLNHCYPMFQLALAHVGEEAARAVHTTWDALARANTAGCRPADIHFAWHFLEVCIQCGVFKKISEDATKVITLDSSTKRALDEAAAMLPRMQQEVMVHVAIPLPRGTVSVELPPSFEPLRIVEDCGGAMRLNMISDKCVERVALRLIPTQCAQHLASSPCPVTPHPCVMRELEFMRCGESHLGCSSVITDDADTTLHHIFEHKIELSWSHRMSIFYSLVCAVEHYHLHGRAHGEIRPENIFLTFAVPAQAPSVLLWRVPLSDSSGFVYCAPEVLCGEQPSRASDIWSLGVVFCQLFAAGYEVPFERSDDPQLMVELLFSIVGIPSDDDGANAAERSSRLAEQLSSVVRFRGEGDAAACASMLRPHPASRCRVGDLLSLMAVGSSLHQSRASADRANFTQDFCLAVPKATQVPQRSYYGVMFDIGSFASDVEVSSIEFVSDVDATMAVKAYLRLGSHEDVVEGRNATNVEEMWEAVHEDSALQVHRGMAYSIHFESVVSIPKDSRVSFYLTTDSDSGVQFCHHPDSRLPAIAHRDDYVYVTTGRASKRSTPFKSVSADERCCFIGSVVYALAEQQELYRIITHLIEEPNGEEYFEAPFLIDTAVRLSEDLSEQHQITVGAVGIVLSNCYFEGRFTPHVRCAFLIKGLRRKWFLAWVPRRKLVPAPDDSVEIDSELEELRGSLRVGPLRPPSKTSVVWHITWVAEEGVTLSDNGQCATTAHSVRTRPLPDGVTTVFLRFATQQRSRPAIEIRLRRSTGEGALSEITLTHSDGGRTVGYQLDRENGTFSMIEDSGAVLQVVCKWIQAHEIVELVVVCSDLGDGEKFTAMLDEVQHEMPQDPTDFIVSPPRTMQSSPLMCATSILVGDLTEGKPRVKSLCGRFALVVGLLPVTKEIQFFFQSHHCQPICERQLELRLLHPTDCSKDVSAFGKNPWVVPSEVLRGLCHSNGQAVDLLVTVFPGSPPVPVEDITEKVHWSLRKDNGDITTSGRTLVQSHIVRESIAQLDVPLRYGVHHIDFTMSAPFNSGVIRLAFISPENPLNIDLEHWWDVSPGALSMAGPACTYSGRCKMTVDVPGRCAVFFIGAAKKHVFRNLPENARLVFSPKHPASRVTIHSWTITESAPDVWGTVCSHCNASKDICQHFVEELPPCTCHSPPSVKTERLQVTKLFQSRENILSEIAQYALFLCAQLTRSALCNCGLLDNPSAAMELLLRLPDKVREHTVRSITAAEPPFLRPLIISAIQTLCGTPALNDPKGHALLELVHSAIDLRPVVATRMVTAEPVCCEVALLLARRACVLTRRDRHVAMEALARLLSQLTHFSEQLLESLQPLFALCDNVFRRTKKVPRVVALGMELVIEARRLFVTQQLKGPLPAAESAVPHTFVALVRETVAAICARQPLPPLLLFASRPHRYYFDDPITDTQSKCEWHVARPSVGVPDTVAFQFVLCRPIGEGEAVALIIAEELLPKDPAHEVRIQTTKCRFDLRREGLSFSCEGGSVQFLDEEGVSGKVRVGTRVSVCLDKTSCVHLYIGKEELGHFEAKDIHDALIIVTHPIGLAKVWPSLPQPLDNFRCASVEADVSIEEFIRRVDQGKALRSRWSVELQERVFGCVKPQPFAFYAQLAECAETLDAVLSATNKPPHAPVADFAAHPLVEDQCSRLQNGTGAVLDVTPLKPYRRVLGVVDFCIRELLGMVDLKSHDSVLTKLFMTTKPLALKSTRREILLHLLGTIPRSNSSACVSLHMLNAKPSMRRHIEATLQSSVFGQLYRQLADQPDKIFRASRVYTARFVGFGSQDAGGPYRESLAQIGVEMQTAHPSGLFHMNPLFAYTANKDAVVPSMLLTNMQHMDMYRFLGKLMAAFLLSSDVLAADLPPLFWKLLLQDPVGAGDLGGVDRTLLARTRPEVLQEFEDITDLYEYFPGLEDAWAHRLQQHKGAPMGAEERAHLLSETIVDLELHRYDPAIDAMRSGFLCVVPFDVFRALHWKDVMDAVCGVPFVTAKALRESSVSQLPPDANEMFWRVVDSMSDADRSLLLAFATGQRRLPLHRRMRLHERGERDSMPSSATCFNDLFLPTYTSEVIMKERVLYAIRHCQAIDADGEADHPLLLHDED